MQQFIKEAKEKAEELKKEVRGFVMCSNVNHNVCLVQLAVLKSQPRFEDMTVSYRLLYLQV